MPKTPPPLSHLADGYGWRLRAARRARGLKAVELARDLNVSPQRLSHWEVERHPPDLHAMLLLKRLHKIPLDWIYAGDPESLQGGLAQRLLALATEPDAPPGLRQFRAQMLGIPMVDYVFPEPNAAEPRAVHDDQAPMRVKPR
jgi:transcriptional regulator with XRE-family HTH domain